MVQDDELAHKPSKQLRERLDELCESTPQVPPEGTSLLIIVSFD